jgi:hypothetical protein
MKSHEYMNRKRQRREIEVSILVIVSRNSRERESHSDDIQRVCLPFTYAKVLFASSCGSRSQILK